MRKEMRKLNMHIVIVLALLHEVRGLKLRIPKNHNPRNNVNKYTVMNDPQKAWIPTFVSSKSPSSGSSKNPTISSKSPFSTKSPTFATFAPTLSATVLSESSKSSAPSDLSVPLNITVTTDEFPGDNSWKLRDVLTKEVILEDGPFEEWNTVYSKEIKVASNMCLLFTIYDSVGDGLNGLFGSAGYELFYNGESVHKGGGEFSEESTYIGCSTSSNPSLAPSSSPSSLPTLSSAPTVSSVPSISSSPTLPLCETSSPWAGVLVFYGMTPQCLLQECAGNCRSDSDCAHGLYCHQPDSDFVAGCETVPYPNINYCVRDELKPSSSPSKYPTSKPSVVPTISSVPSESLSSKPSALPTIAPSSLPSESLSSKPSMLPTISSSPSRRPTEVHSISPTVTMVRSFCLSRHSFVRSFVRIDLTYGNEMYCFIANCFSLSFPYDAFLPTQSPTTECETDWKQLGNAIYTTYNDFAMAADRMVVAVRRGDFVQVFSFDNESELWVQIGEAIKIEISDDNDRLVLSSDGDVLAVSDVGYDNRRGRVIIFALNSNSGWTQVGGDIVGENYGDRFGDSLEVSADGTSVAIGAPENDNNNGIHAGHVRVYKYSNKSGSWEQKGQDIDGEAEGDLSGESVAMSRDGNIVAIGARYNSGTWLWSGHVRAYQFIRTKQTWAQLGADIDGETNGDYSGWSVAMSGDGLTLAIGAPGNDGNGVGLGHVRVYRYNQTNSNWVQLGNDIDGVGFYDESGRSIDMSNDGTTVVIGAYKADRNGKSDVGKVRVYRFVTAMGDWAQVGGDVYGDAEYDFLGRDVSMSGDSTLIGALGLFTTALKLFKRNTCDPTHPPSSMPTRTFKVSLHSITTDTFPKHSCRFHVPIPTPPFLRFCSI